MSAYEWRLFSWFFVFASLAITLVQGLSVQCFAAEPPEASIVWEASEGITAPESFIPWETMYPNIPHDIVPDEPDSPEVELEIDLEPVIPDGTYQPDFLDSGYGASTIYPGDLTFNPPDLTTDRAIYHIRFCAVFFVFGIIPLYTAIFLVWQFFKWVYGLCASSL